jgi:hypothetical protein
MSLRSILRRFVHPRQMQVMLLQLFWERSLSYFPSAKVHFHRWNHNCLSATLPSTSLKATTALRCWKNLALRMQGDVAVRCTFCFQHDPARCRSVVSFLRRQLGRYEELDLNNVTVNGLGAYRPTLSFICCFSHAKSSGQDSSKFRRVSSARRRRTSPCRPSLLRRSASRLQSRPKFCQMSSIVGFNIDSVLQKNISPCSKPM